MNVDDFMKTGGYVTVKNPNYNPKAKKNKQPKYIQQLDLSGKEKDPITSPLIDDADNRFSVPGEVVDKYARYGITYNRVSKNLDGELAKAQSSLTQTFNGLAQAVVSEVIGGTVQAITDMGGTAYTLVDTLADKILGDAYDRDESKDFSNPVSEKIQEWRDTFDNEVVPIYTDPEKNIQNGALGSWGWYMKGFPQLMSSLTLLIPSRLATVGIGKAVGAVSKFNRSRKIEKAIKAASEAKNVKAARTMADEVATVPNLNWIERQLYNPIRNAQLKHAAQIGSDALIMRSLENYQEARQTHQDTYKTALQQFNKMNDAAFEEWKSNNTDELGKDIQGLSRDQLAKRIAVKAADRTFLIDYSNIVFDIMQLGAIHQVGKLPKKIKAIKAKIAQRESIAGAGKTSEEIVESAAKGGIKKYKDLTKDVLLGGGSWFLKESTEGIEEAINYIAQQEGITYGKALLDGETDSTLKGFFNSRLADYLGDAELQESAFWGWLGGLTFGGAMNLYTKHNIYKQRKARIDAINKLRGEGRNEDVQVDKGNEDWLTLSELPEVYAATEAIRKRNSKLNKLSSDFKLVDDGKNPYDIDEETREYNNIENDSENAREGIKAQLIKDYRASIAMDAINSGTYDMLTDYLSSKGVRKAFVDLGIASEEKVDAFINETLSDLHNTKELYQSQLANVNYQITALNKKQKFDEQIPIEYVQQIAKFNTDRLLEINKIDKQLNLLNKQRAEIENNSTGDAALTEEEKAKGVQALKIQQLSVAYGRLEAKKQEIRNDENLSDWRKAESIDDINRQQEGLLNYMKSNMLGNSLTNQAQSLGAMLYVIRASKAFKPYGQFDFDGEYQKTDEELIKEFDKWFDNKDIELASIQSYWQQTLKDIEDLNKKGGLYDKNAQAYDLYGQIADLEVSKAMTRSMIAETQSQLRNSVDTLHNRHNRVRNDLLAKAEKSIRDIYLKYNGDDKEIVRQVIIDSFFNDKESAQELARTRLTQTDQDGNKDGDLLNSAINILNFSQGANRSAFRYILDVLEMADQKDRVRSQNTTTNQNPSESNNNEQPTNTSADTQQAGSEAESGQNESQNGEIRYAVIELNPNGEVTKVTPKSSVGTNEVAITMVPRQDGNYNLDVNSITGNNVTPQQLYSNSDWFTYNGDILQDDVEVDTLPVVNEQGHIVEKGKLKKVGEDNQQQPDNSQDETQSIPSTGGQQSSVQPGAAPASNPSTEPEIIQGINGESEESEDDDKVQLVREILASDGLINFENPAANDWNDIRQFISDNAENNNQGIAYNDGELQSIIDNVVGEVQELLGTVANSNSDLGAEAAQTVMASKVASRNKGRYGNIFTTSIDQLLENYVKLQRVQTVEVPMVGMGTVTKKLISGRDILAIIDAACNTSDKTRVENTFNMFLDYILNDTIGSSKYFLIDEEDCKDGTVIKELRQGPTLSVEDNSASVGLDNQRVDISYAIELMNDPDQQNVPQVKDLKEAFNRLKAGDTLRVMHVGNGLELFTENGVAIGSLPLAKTTEWGTYYQYNEGWRTEVSLDPNGRVISPFKDLVTYLFTSNDKEAIEVQTILNEMIADAVVHRSDSSYKLDWEKYGEKLEGTGYFQYYLSQDEFRRDRKEHMLFYDYETEEVPWNDIVKHLYKLYGYTSLNIGATNINDKNRLITASINKWFEKLYYTYSNLYRFPAEGGTATVKYVSEGKIHTKFAAKPETHYQDCPKFSEAIADKSNVALGYTTRNQILVSSGRTAKNIGFNVGYCVAIEGKKTNPDVVKALGYRYGDTEQNAMFNALGATFQNRLANELYNLWSNNGYADGDAVFANIEKLITDFVFCYSGKDYDGPNSETGIKVLGSRVTDNDGKVQHFKIDYNRDRTTNKPYGIIIKIFDGAHWQRLVINRKTLIEGTFKNQVSVFREHTQTNPNTGKEETVRDVKLYQTKGTKAGAATPLSMTNTITRFFLDYGQFNINKNGIDSDNSKQEIKDGFIRRENTDNGQKVRVLVTKKDANNQLVESFEEFDSYSDFVCNSDLIRVNTEILPDGTNYESTPFNQRANQQVIVNLQGTTTPVANNGKRQFNSDIEGDTNKAIKKQLRQQLEDYSKHIRNNDYDVTDKLVVMRKLFEIAGRGNIFDELISICNELEIDLPIQTNLIFDEEFNSDDPTQPADKQTAYQNVAGTATQDSSERTYHYWNNTLGRDSTKRLQTGKTVVGNVWLNMLSSNQLWMRNAAIRTLIHEQLHIELIKNGPNRRRELVNQIEEIYNAFLNQLSILDSVDEYDRAYIEDWLDRYRNRQVNPERVLEEFMVEAMTSQEFYNVLNAMEQTEGYTPSTSKKESLFTKIINLIKRIFGWNDIQDDKLYRQLYDKLRELSTEPSPVTAEEIMNNEPVQEASSQEEPTQEPETPAEPEPGINSEEVPDNIDDFGFGPGTSDDDGFVMPFSAIAPRPRENRYEVTAASIILTNMPLSLRENAEKLIKAGYISIKC